MGVCARDDERGNERGEAPMSKQISANRFSAVNQKSQGSQVEDSVLLPVALPMKDDAVATEWCADAQNIVAYPEDYGMTREQVRGLRLLLAQRREQLRRIDSRGDN
jgi:hypothetical protein